MTILEVFIFRGEQFLGSRVFSQSPITIGRGSASLLTLEDRQISRHHASIIVDGPNLILRDEGSQIGTFINGEPVKERTFRQTDSIEIGSFRLKISRRSMRAALDFEQDEPTDAGQRRLAAEWKAADPARSAEPSGSLRVTAASPPAALRGMNLGEPAAKPTLPLPQVQKPAPAPGASGAHSATPAPVAPKTSGTQPAAPSRPPLLIPQIVVESSSRVDSPTSELRAGLDDSIQFTAGSAVTPVVVGHRAGAKANEAVREFEVEPPTLRRPDTPPPVREDDPTREFNLQAATMRRRDSAAVPAQSGPATALLPAEPAPAVSDQDHGDDEDEERFVPSFSLLEMLDREPLPAQDKAPLLFQVIQHRDQRVIDVHQLARRTSFSRGGRRLVRLDRQNRAQLAVTDDVSGTVFLEGRMVTIEEVRRGAKDRKGVALLEMRAGDHADLAVARPDIGGAERVQSHYHLRFVSQPAVPRSPLQPRRVLQALANRFLLGAVLVHAVILGGLTLLPSSDVQGSPEEPRFAEVSLKQIRVEPPPPVAPPEPEPPPPVQPEAPKVPKATRTMRVRQRTPSARPDPAQSALAALDALKPADTASPLKDVVTNINAVSVPADARSRFKVGGAIGKLPIGEVRVSTAGAARDATASGRELLSKENVGALKGAGGSGNVRGVVKQAPPAALQAAGSGRLSRAQIQKVINEHVAQVQACYERNLMRDHSLAGKVTFDWVIAESGSVASARVRSSTMAGSSVSACILQEIRSWTFPAPEGGTVAVTYPFIFSAQGF